MTTVADRYGLGEDFGIVLGDLACLPFLPFLAATLTLGDAVRDDDLDGRRCTVVERIGEMIIWTMCWQVMDTVGFL